MNVVHEVSAFSELCKSSWGGAIDTLDTIRQEDLEDELMQFLEDTFADEYVTDVALNDFLWFDRDTIFECLGIEED